MTALDDVKPGAMIRGVVPGHSVRIGSVDWIGNQAINLVYREPDGGISETTLYRDDENRLGNRDARLELIIRRRRQPVTLGPGSKPDRARASFQSPSRHSHQPSRSIAAPDLRRLWRDAGASSVALPADRRSGGREARIPVRRALLNYAFKRFGLDTDPSARCPQDQQVILLNRDSVIATMTLDVAEGSR